MTHPITGDTVSTYDRELLHDRLDEVLLAEAPDGVRIAEQCLRLAHMLAKKNAAYGNSALHPTSFLSDMTAEQRLRVRIDDKLNRLVNGGNFAGDDDMLDLTGYLILLMIARES